ncbi:uncharacterized protein LOC109949803 [Prunus persica]|uniref:uncharacterized protein LOC109949803 n=1 Tax=Prunus persica TaxID=3760 RepID=UPI0009AB6170|nr:uncharacterized protein LOC109949803 [Prunus persica]
MDRYYKRKFSSTTSSLDNVGSSSLRDVGILRDVVGSSKESELQDVLANLPANPGLQPQLLDYDPNIRDEIFVEARSSFHGNKESDTPNNKGNNVELLQFLVDHDEKVKAVVLENALGNLKLIAPTIQKDLVNTCATETIKKIIKDMNGAFFSLLVDESRYISVKKQMGVVFRYVDKKGDVIERFVSIQHVSDTISNSLKEAIYTLFSREELSTSLLRGQGYDGASKMKGEFNGHKTQILRENPCAYYIHYFAHQLQLALVAMAKGNADVATFFTSCDSLVNIVGASSTIDLSQALQRKDQDIGNAMSLVKDCTTNMRDNGFEALLDQVSSFCGKHDIEVPNVDDAYVANWRSHRKAPRITKIHHYRMDIFIQIIEWQLAELNHRSSEVNTELLLCLACLNSNDSFIAFDKQKLLRFAKFYPQEFTPRDLLALEDQLGIYIHHMCTRSDFSQLKGIGSLARKMVEK